MCYDSKGFGWYMLYLVFIIVFLWFLWSRCPHLFCDSLCLCPIFLCLRYVFRTYVNSIFTCLWQTPFYQRLLCERRKSTGFTLRDYPPSQNEWLMTVQPNLGHWEYGVGGLGWNLSSACGEGVASLFCLPSREHVSRSCGPIPGPARESLSTMKPVRGEISGAPWVQVCLHLDLSLCFSVLWPISLFIKPTSSQWLSTCHLPIFLPHPSPQNTCWHPWESVIWLSVSER